jgi:DNA helicase HerA-like ATPase
MSADRLIQDAVLRVGEVCAVDGRKIYVLVDKNKNLTDLFLDGDILKNISVNSFVEIRKGFLSLIGRVEGEKIEEDRVPSDDDPLQFVNRSKRILTVALSGYIDEQGHFTGGTKELPLIGNEAYIVTREKIARVHNLAVDDSPRVSIANIYGDDLPVEFPIDGLFNSHIAIFGNTGSGKSNTLASLYQELVRVLASRHENAFRENTRFVVFDFNGEYTRTDCIWSEKKVYSLSTREAGDKIPLKEDALLDMDVLPILAEATEKTQKPFLKRALSLYERVFEDADEEDARAHIRNILRKCVKDVLQMSDKERAKLLIDYFEEILPPTNDDGEIVNLTADIEWNNTHSEYMLKPGNIYLASDPDEIANTVLYQHVECYKLEDSLLARLITFLYIQLTYDVLANRSQNDHIAPVINRLKAKKNDIDKLFELDDAANFWESNFVVVSLARVNIGMKKTLPLLLAKQLYDDHKALGPNKSLTIIVDEAHNILSTESVREAESWKDYRLETFEEIIKEGRKFGVFVTIASQRPNDISPTITSQAHNYFIHRLINDGDLKTIASAVSYIDRVTQESIPTLPTGTCVFSGVATQMPLKINVRELAEHRQPKSETRKFSVMVSNAAVASVAEPVAEPDVVDDFDDEIPF